MENADDDTLYFLLPISDDTRCVRFTIDDDDVVEADETFVVAFGSEDEDDIFVYSEANITILDDESKSY